MTRRHFLALSTAAASVAKAESEPEEVPLVRFGLTTDVQYADAAPEGERHYRESIPKLKAAVADLAKQKLPFTLHLGDLIDRDWASFAAVLPLLDGLGHPVYHLLGNHDYNIVDAQKDHVAKALGMPADYYAFTVSGVRFVMCDTNDVSTYKYPQDSVPDHAAETELTRLAATGASQAKPWNGGVSAKQLEWLDKELTTADQAKMPVIVCGHHPLVPATGHQAWNSQEILSLFDKHSSVRAYLCGHNHAGNEVVHHQIPCINFKSILHEPGTTAYAVVQLFKNRLVIEGRGREASRTLALPLMA